MEKFLRNQYGYGVARLPIPAQVVTSVEHNKWQWLYHPSFVGLLGLLLIAWALRSCSTTLIRPEKTILWVHHTPTVKPEKIQTKTPVPKIPRPLRKEPEIIKKTTPPLLVPQKVMPRPKQLMLKKPVPLPQPKVSMERLVEKQLHRIDNQPLTHPHIAEMQPAQQMAALSPQHQPQAQKRYNAIDNRPITSPQQAPRALKSRQEKRRNVKMASTDFEPLPLSDTPSRISGLAAQKQLSSNRTTLVAGERKVSASPISNLPTSRAPSLPATPAANDRRKGQRPTTLPQGTSFTPDLSQTPTVSTISDASNAIGDDESVEIIGRIIGESPRIENLKRTIFAKAASLDWRYGPYCCTINGITCRLRFISDQKISISFSQSDIPFEVLSKLERRLPEGLRPCVH